MNIFVFVIDGFGIKNDKGLSTFENLNQRVSLKKHDLSFMYSVGFGNAVNNRGNLLYPLSTIAGSLEGHREMMGYISANEYDICDRGIPAYILDSLFIKTNIPYIGNVQGRGHSVIPLFAEKIVGPCVIIYTGYDSTISIAYEESIYSQRDIENYADKLLELLCQKGINIRKIIIRQYNKGFHFVKKRKEVFCKIDFNKKMDHLGFDEIRINNKIQDILCLKNATVIDCDSDSQCIDYLKSHNGSNCLFFINFPDFDMYAHQGNFSMCATTLKNIDVFLKSFKNKMCLDDYVLITADHGVQIGKSDLSSAHVLEKVSILCFNNKNAFLFPGTNSGFGFIYDTIYRIKNHILLNDDCICFRYNN